MSPTRLRRRHLAVALVCLLAALLVALLWLFATGDPSGGAGGQGRVASAPVSVTITGEADGVIAPGVAVPLNLSFHNPHDFSLVLGEVHVSVSNIAAPLASDERTCTSADYVVRQLTSGAPLTIAADGSTDLRELGLERVEWPAVTLVDRPVNQDGCKDASLTLTYEALGTEVSR